MTYFVLEVTLTAVNSYLWEQVNLLPVKGVIRKRTFKVILRSGFILER